MLCLKFCLWSHTNLFMNEHMYFHSHCNIKVDCLMMFCIPFSREKFSATETFKSKKKIGLIKTITNSFNRTLKHYPNAYDIYYTYWNFTSEWTVILCFFNIILEPKESEQNSQLNFFMWLTASCCFKYLSFSKILLQKQHKYSWRKLDQITAYLSILTTYLLAAIIMIVRNTVINLFCKRHSENIRLNHLLSYKEIAFFFYCLTNYYNLDGLEPDLLVKTLTRLHPH